MSRDMQVFMDEKQNSVHVSCRYGHLKVNFGPQQLRCDFKSPEDKD